VELLYLMLDHVFAGGCQKLTNGFVGGATVNKRKIVLRLKTVSCQQSTPDAVYDT
jgi:hypothetical protein